MRIDTKGQTLPQPRNADGNAVTPCVTGISRGVYASSGVSTPWEHR